MTAAVIDVDRRPLEEACPDVAELREGQGLHRKHRMAQIAIRITGSAKAGTQFQQLAAALQGLGKSSVSASSAYRSFAQQMALVNGTAGATPEQLAELERKVLALGGGSRFRREWAAFETALTELGDQLLEAMHVDGVALLAGLRWLGRWTLLGFAAVGGYVPPPEYRGAFHRGGVVPKSGEHVFMQIKGRTWST